MRGETIDVTWLNRGQECICTLSTVWLFSTLFIFFFNDTATTHIYTLSLHDALPISTSKPDPPQLHEHRREVSTAVAREQSGNILPNDDSRSKFMHHPRELIEQRATLACRSEEHTSELQSQFHLVCRLLLEKKKQNQVSDSDRPRSDRTLKRRPDVAYPAY